MRKNVYLRELKDSYYWISGMTTVLSFERNPILGSSRKRGWSWCYECWLL